jgi:hypothetical protein
MAPQVFSMTMAILSLGSVIEKSKQK